VPILVAAVERRVMPVEIRAFGNVEAYATVAIKARIDGQIIAVHFREGQDVRQGDPLFDIDPKPFAAVLHQVEAELLRDKAQLDQARLEERRYLGLLKKNAVTQDQYDQVRTAVEVAGATVHAAEAAVENAKVQLGYTTVRSPIDGRTGRILIQLGNLVKANDTNALVVINQIDPIYVTFSVPEHFLDELRSRQAAGALKVQAALPNTLIPPVAGSLAFVDNAVDSSTGTVRLKALFDNTRRVLWPGQFAAVALTLKEQPDAVVVPSAAVQTGPKGQYVFVVKPDLTAEMREVRVDRSQGEETVIAEGLHPGETVVTTGQSRLVPGAKVVVKEGRGVS
jgi:multidrug efflux system membrane fusion protein